MKKMANLDEDQFRVINYTRKNKKVEQFVHKKQKESQEYKKKLNDEKGMFPVGNFSSLQFVLKN